MDSMILLHKKICMFLTVKISQDKTWLRDIFISNCCSCIQSVLTSVKSLTLITSLDLLKIQNLINNWLDHALSPNLMPILTTELSDLINTLLSSLLEWDKIWQESQNQRKAKNLQNSKKLLLFIELPSNLSKLRFWSCWKTLFIMLKLNLIGDRVLTYKIKTKKPELLNSVVS